MPHSHAPFAFAVTAAQHLRAPDLLLIAAYLLAITLFGLLFRNRGPQGDRSLKSYFLAGNTVPWWAIALSIVSAETSTLTIISIPGVAFAGDFGFLQVVLGYLVGRVVVAALFLPRYFAGEMLTAYQLIDRRFGPVLHKVTAGLFLLTRAAAEGVRVFAVSIVVTIAIGTGDVLSIAIITALTLLYTFEGGLAAVIWTDVVQMAIYVAGTLVALVSLGHHVPGGWHAIMAQAGSAGKLHIFSFNWDLTRSYTFWAGLLGGTFLTMASHGTDQLMVQRLLAARSLRESRLALLSSGIVILAQFAFFLLIGAGLWVYYGHTASTAFRSNDYIFPTFITREMPTGIAGLLVAAILAAAMSNLSAALNSLSSTTVVDFYVRARPEAPERERTLVSKASTALWALVLFAIAIVSLRAGGHGHVVEVGLSIASVAYGCLLGVFLLGTLTRFATERGAILGMIVGFTLNLWLWQGSFPARLGPLTLPHIAFTWYVLIGAAVTFLVGSAASLVFRKASRTNLGAIAMTVFCMLPLTKALTRPACAQKHTAKPDFTQVSTLIETAIAQHQLPGAVVSIGHGGTVVFEHAYGVRRLAGEPDLYGSTVALDEAGVRDSLSAQPAHSPSPSPAEPMTVNTLFDMASLTKCIVTTTAILQLYEQGKLDVDAPVERYLPEFNSTHDPQRAQVTVRLLLTHFSGEAPDISLKDPWGLAAPDKAEGIHRALTHPLANPPASKFVYSDINFILLGAMVERLSGQPLDAYAYKHIFRPLGMENTRYHGVANICGQYKLLGSAVHVHFDLHTDTVTSCGGASWNTDDIRNTAPTAHDDEGTAETNPDFNQLLRGTVHDPTTRRMGGVAGHAGVFSTAHDMSLFAQALLDRFNGRPSRFPLKRETLVFMTEPQQPGHTPAQVDQHNLANLAAIAAGQKSATGDPALLDPNFPAVKDEPLRGFGWDIDTGYSKPRGRFFPIGSFGHTGFTGTSLWLDPASDTYVLLLSNAIHPRVGGSVSNLRGEVASAAALALGLAAPSRAESSLSNADRPPSLSPVRLVTAGFVPVRAAAPTIAPTQSTGKTTLTGIDVLEQEQFAPLAALRPGKPLRLALLTNQTGLDSQGRRTMDLLFNDLPKTLPQARLVALFSPEHGIFGKQDTEHLDRETDSATGLHVTSLYGAKASDRHPTHEQLKELDAVLIDLQDAGVRCFTYETVVGYFLEAAAAERTQFGHDLTIVVLDRPNPLGGLTIAGPTSDPGTESYINYQPIPLQHGLTLGELARYTISIKHLDTHLIVISMRNWQRSQLFDATGLPWTPPSPNLHTVNAALLYPATTLLELTHLSVGRGTPMAFEVFGAGTPSAGQAPWFDATAVASTLNARKIPGVHFEAIRLPVPEDKNQYPGHGQTISAVHLVLTDPVAFPGPRTGVEILCALQRLYPAQLGLERTMRLLANRSTLDAINRGDDPRAIATAWDASLASFGRAREASLLY